MVSKNQRAVPILSATKASAVSSSSSRANIDYEYRLKQHEMLIAPSEQFSSLCNEYLKDTRRNDENDKKNDYRPSRCSTTKKNRMIIENLIRKCNLVDDPLKHWLNYIDFIKREYDGCQHQHQHRHRHDGPSKHIRNKSKQNNDSGRVNHSLFLIMKRCTLALFHHPHYKNDPRYIRIIVLYADQLNDSNKTEELFWHYHKQKIGIQTAVFWISFAFIMEKNFDYKEANRIYIRGMNVNAQPMHIILKRYQGFQQRVRYYGIDLGGGIDLQASKDSSIGSEIQSQCNDCDMDKNDHCSTSNKVNDHNAQEQHEQQNSHIAKQKVDDDKYNSNDYAKQQRFQDLQFSTIISHPKSGPSTPNFTVYRDVQDTPKNKHYYALPPNIDSCNRRSSCSKSKTIMFGFNIHRLALEEKEKCFEECRAESKCYKLVKFVGKNVINTQKHHTMDSNSRKANDTKKLKRKSSCVDCSADNIHSPKRRNTRGMDYVSLHGKNITTALIRMTRRAFIKPKETSLMQNLVLNRTSSTLPRGLKKDYKRSFKVNIEGQDILVKNKLGAGSYGTVILCSTLSSPDENIALKIQKEPRSLAWEYEILENLKARTKGMLRDRFSSNSAVFPSPLTFTLFSDGATMGMTAVSTTGLNILDVVNAHKGSVPELLAIFYTSRMLKYIEILHFTAKTLHCDIKPDNWVLTTPSNTTCSSGIFSRTASDVMLVDFGRAVDIMELSNGGLYGNVAAKDLECVAMRSGHAWAYDVDTYGICVCAHILLHGSYLDVVKDPKSNRWRPTKPFRRYWQHNLWKTLFDSFLHMKAPVNLNEYAYMIKQIRKGFDTYLSNEKRKSELISLLTKQERLLPQKGLQGETKKENIIKIPGGVGLGLGLGLDLGYCF